MRARKSSLHPKSFGCCGCEKFWTHWLSTQSSFLSSCHAGEVHFVDFPWRLRCLIAGIVYAVWSFSSSNFMFPFHTFTSRHQTCLWGWTHATSESRYAVSKKAGLSKKSWIYATYKQAFTRYWLIVCYLRHSRCWNIKSEMKACISKIKKSRSIRHEDNTETENKETPE